MAIGSTNIQPGPSSLTNTMADILWGNIFTGHTSYSNYGYDYHSLFLTKNATATNLSALSMVGFSDADITFSVDVTSLTWVPPDGTNKYINITCNCAWYAEMTNTVSQFNIDIGDTESYGRVTLDDPIDGDRYCYGGSGRLSFDRVSLGAAGAHGTALIYHLDPLGTGSIVTTLIDLYS